MRLYQNKEKVLKDIQEYSWINKATRIKDSKTFVMPKKNSIELEEREAIEV